MSLGAERPLQDEEEGMMLEIPTAILVATAETLEIITRDDISPISIATHLISSISTMDAAIKGCIGTTISDDMSDEDRSMLRLYYDATKRCLTVSNKIKQRASRVGYELRKINIAHDYEREGHFHEALARLVDIDTNGLCLGDELDREIKSTIEAYDKVSKACEEELQRVSKKAKGGKRSMLMATLYAVTCAVVAVGGLFFPISCAVTASIALVAFVGGAIGATVATVVAVRKGRELYKLNAEITEQQKKLEVARRDCFRLNHSLQTIQAKIQHASTTIEDHTSAVDEVQKGLLPKHLEQFFQDNFEDVTTARDEVQDLCDAADTLYTHALEAFDKFGKGGEHHDFIMSSFFKNTSK